MSTTTIYTDHRGDEITVGEGLLTACTPGGTALSIPLDADHPSSTVNRVSH